MNSASFQYGSETLQIGTAIALANGSLKGTFTPETIRKIKASQQYGADHGHPEYQGL